jgi:peptide chain release factor subunit 1
MARTITWEELRDLAAFEAENGCAVSLYVNLDPSLAPTPGAVDTRVHSLLDEGAKAGEARSAELTHAQRQALKADFERIRRFYDDDFVRDGARGLAIFAAGLDNIWRPLALTEPVDDEVRVSNELYLAPLVPLVGRGEGALVVAVSRERGQIYRLRAGRLEEVENLSDSQPRRHDQGGWSQARYQRRIDNLALEHLRDVADRLDAIVRRERALRVIVVATDEAWAELSELLSQEAAASVVGRAAAEAHASPAQLLDVSLPLLEEWRIRMERETVERWREEAGRNGRATGGWAATLEAASDGRVEILLVQPGAERTAWRCPACGRLAAAPGKCPLDGTSLEQRSDALDLVVHQTLTHGGSVWAVRHHRDLEPLEGIGAVLRY